MKNLHFSGLPEKINETDQALFRSRIYRVFTELHTKYPEINDFKLSISNFEDHLNDNKSEKIDNGNTGNNSIDGNVLISPIKPRFTFDQLIVDSDTLENLKRTIELLNVEKLVFEEWGLNLIEPFPRVALNFHGNPGTGKTMAAHALAEYLSKKIIIASYADIESKYHGDGPKNVQHIFKVAQEEDSVLFIDEADSLLSKRLENVSQGSEQAINSMRSQILICLEQFKGVVIFATNLVKQYDKAFKTRVVHVKFSLPDEECRKKIWDTHLVPKLPIDDDVDTNLLAKEFDKICGREIKNAVINAAVNVARKKRKQITHQDFKDAMEFVLKSNSELNTTTEERENITMSDNEINVLEKKISAELKEQNI